MGESKHNQLQLPSAGAAFIIHGLGRVSNLRFTQGSCDCIKAFSRSSTRLYKRRYRGRRDYCIQRAILHLDASSVDTSRYSLGDFYGKNINPSLKNLILLPGKFDALHLGHKKLLESAASIGTPLFLTFPGMGDVLGWKPRKPIVPDHERTRILEEWALSLGISIVFDQLQFNQIRALSPEQFMDLLVSRYSASGVVCGFNWRFGFKAQGTTDTLQSLAAERDLKVIVVPSLSVQNETISSTRVRRILSEEGDVSTAKLMLGRYYKLFGTLSGALEKDESLVIDQIENYLPKSGLYEACIQMEGRVAPLWGVVRIQECMQSETGQDRILVEGASHLYCGTSLPVTVELRRRCDE